MMKKLYRQIDGEWHYEEAWLHEGEVTHHWGRVGQPGQTKAHRGSDESDLDGVLAAAVQKGFAPVSLDDHHILVVSYPCDGWGSPGDLKKRHYVEELLNEALGWTGNGHCDGGEIGSGSIEAFSFVVSRDHAVDTTRSCLANNRLLDGLRIGFQDPETGHVDFVYSAPEAVRVVAPASESAPSQTAKKPWWKRW
jgi:hypothetical protein